MPRSSVISKKLRKQVLGSTTEYVEGMVKVIPNCEYRAKKIYDLNGLGELFSGAYYTKKVRHIFDNGYKVELDVIMVDESIKPDIREDNEMEQATLETE